MTDLFISYRRGLDRHAAGRLHAELAKKFGHRRIFMDVDNIPAGDDFEKRLGQSVARCNVLLAVISPEWARVRDGRGHLRLFQSGDFVRIEISAALERGITVVPVLIDSATMPTRQELPADLHGLTRCHAVWLRHDRFSSDVLDLAGSIKNQIGLFAGLRRAWRSFITLDQRIVSSDDSGPSLAAIGDEPNLGLFVASRVVAKSGSSIPAAVLYEQYCLWCEEVGIQPKALPTFGRELAEFGFQKVKKPDGVHYVNLHLKPVSVVPQPMLMAITDVQKFYTQQVVGAQGATLSATALYEAYADWCEVRGREPLALPTFGREIAEFGIRKVKKKDGVRYVDIALREDYESLR